MKAAGILFSVLAVCLSMAGAEITWEKDSLSAWRALWNCSAGVKDGVLKIENIKKDSSIVCDCSLVSRQYNVMEIRYRASGIAKRTGGQLYYLNDSRRYADSRKWFIPSLNGDGRFHTMRLMLGIHSNNIPDWLNGGKIVRLRIDMMDQAGGTIEILSIRLSLDPEQPVVQRPDPARPTDAPAWPDVRPEFLSPQVGGSYFRGKMIYAPGDTPAACPKTFCMRRTFSLKEPPVRAVLQFIADDEAEVYVDGKHAASQKGLGSWQKTTRTEVSGLLHKGKNVLAVLYRNNGSHGGFFGELFLKYSDGSCEKIDSGHEFRASDTVQEGWMTEAFDDSGWKTAMERPGPPAPPWGIRLDYSDFARPQELQKMIFPDGGFSGGDTLRWEAVLKGVSPEPGTPLEIHLCRTDGSRVFSEKIKLNRENIVPHGDGTWTLKAATRLPGFLPSGPMLLSADGLYLEHGKLSGRFTYRNAAKGRKNLTAEIRNTNGTPRLFVDGKAFYPVIGCVPVNAPPDAMPMNLRLMVPEKSFWTGEHKFDFHVFDAAAAKLFQAFPQAKAIVQLDMYEPESWRTNHPGELAINSRGKLPAHIYGKSSFASELFRRDAEEAISKCVEYLEHSEYAERIVGYRVAGGHTNEWLGWGYQNRDLFDYSEPSRRRFADWCSERNLPFRNMPSEAERLASSGQFLLDPEKDAAVIAWNLYDSECTADLLIRLCRTVKKTCGGKKLAGTYYGYTMFLGGGAGFQTSGHFALKKLLDSGTVDFLTSPQSYSVRNLGETFCDMKPFKTILNHNVLPIIEDDTRTHNMPPSGRFQTMTAWHTIQALRRNLAFSLCRGEPGMLFLLESGCHDKFNFPGMSSLVRDIRTAGQFVYEKQLARHTETAFVVSEKSFCFMPWEKDFISTGRINQVYDNSGKAVLHREWLLRMTGSLISGQLNDLARSGAPVDYVLAEDIADNPGDYKLYIFANCFACDARFLKAVERLRKKKTTLLWLCAPGVISGGTFSTENMKRLTGFDFTFSKEPMTPVVSLPDGTAAGLFEEKISPVFGVTGTEGVSVRKYLGESLNGYAERRNGPSRSIFCGAWFFTPEFYCRLAKESGVHVFTESHDPCEFGNSMAAVHARFPGRKEFVLPSRSDVLDVFGKKMIARGTDRFSADFRMHETKLFYWGADADGLLYRLKTAEAPSRQ